MEGNSRTINHTRLDLHVSHPFKMNKDWGKKKKGTTILLLFSVKYFGDGRELSQ